MRGTTAERRPAALRSDPIGDGIDAPLIPPTKEESIDSSDDPPDMRIGSTGNRVGCHLGKRGEPGGGGGGNHTHRKDRESR